MHELDFLRPCRPAPPIGRPTPCPGAATATQADQPGLHQRVRDPGPGRSSSVRDRCTDRRAPPRRQLSPTSPVMSAPAAASGVWAGSGPDAWRSAPRRSRPARCGSGERPRGKPGHQTQLQRVLDQDRVGGRHRIQHRVLGQLHLAATGRQPLEGDPGHHGHGPEVGRRSDSCPAATPNGSRRCAARRWLRRALAWESPGVPAGQSNSVLRDSCCVVASVHLIGAGCICYRNSAERGYGTMLPSEFTSLPKLSRTLSAFGGTPPLIAT